MIFNDPGSRDARPNGQRARPPPRQVKRPIIKAGVYNILGMFT